MDTIPPLMATVCHQNAPSLRWHGHLAEHKPSTWLDGMLHRCFPDDAAALQSALAEGRTLRARLLATPAGASPAAAGNQADVQRWHEVVFSPGSRASFTHSRAGGPNTA